MMIKHKDIRTSSAVIIDNVIASGTTAVAALNALGEKIDENSFVLALADDSNCNKITIFNH